VQLTFCFSYDNFYVLFVCGCKFADADSFNGDLSLWNVSRVMNASRMFYDAHMYNQSLCAWRYRLPLNASTTLMFADSACRDPNDPSALLQSPYCVGCV
jgi:Mycoplasma protein of unknown function, DUF285